MMKLILDREMPQGSKEWRLWRKSLAATATDAGDILRLWSPFDDAVHSWEEKRQRARNGYWVPTNDAMRHGRAAEPLARDYVNALGIGRFEPACVEVDGTDWSVGASLDGLDVDDTDGRWLEIKCPYAGERSSVWRDARHDLVAEHYMPQLAFQAWCLGRPAYGVFAVYIPTMFNRYTGRQEMEEQAIILEVEYGDLEPYIDQLNDLVPLWANGSPEPTLEEYPMIGAMA